MQSNPYELNFSKIKTYRECPLSYKYKYVEGKKEGLVPASSLGVSIHRALEAYHRHSNDPSELISYYDDCWLCLGYKTAGEQMEWYLKGKQMLETYAQREYERNTTVDSTEREFIFKEGEWTLRGKIDRIDKHPDGSWEVIDYKTGTDVDTDTQVTDSLQLGIYAIGARRAWNMERGQASIYFVAFDKKVSAPFDSFDEQKILNIFIETGKKIVAEDYTPNTASCATCPYNTRCDKVVLPDTTAANNAADSAADAAAADTAV